MDRTAPKPVGFSRKKVTQKPEGTAPKVLRLATFLVIVSAIGIATSYQRARGQLREVLLSTGAQMMLLADAERQDDPRQIVLNGQRIQFSTGVVPYPVSELLDRFESACEQIDAGLMERMAETLAMRPEWTREHQIPVRPLMRDEQSDAGYVACLDLGRDRVETGVLIERFREFERTRDLHSIGDLRYVYATPMADGRAHFVALWTDGSLRFDQVFPETGDVLGEDPADVPRPPGARRILSAYETGDSQRATFYETAELDEGGLDLFYRRELPTHGWRLLDGPRTTSANARPALVAERNGRMLWFAFVTDMTGRTAAAVIETSQVADEG
jgi:hypothetical protein